MAAKAPQEVQVKGEFLWSSEQRLRVAGQVLASMVNMHMTQDEIDHCAEVSLAAAKALERAFQGPRKFHLRRRVQPKL